MTMSFPDVPGVKILEVRLSAPPIIGAGTSTAGFVGASPKSGRRTNQTRLVTSLDQFVRDYVSADPAVAGDADATQSTPLSRAVFGFFNNGGTTCYVVNVDSINAADVVSGLKQLRVLDDVRIIAAPDHVDATVWTELKDQAETLGDRFSIYDVDTTDPTTLVAGAANRPPDSKYAATYFPRIQVGPDLQKRGDPGSSDPATAFISPVGHVAGVYARVDANRGVHKAPASEQIMGAIGVQVPLTDGDQEALNPAGVNAIRVFGGTATIWGARTLQDPSDAAFDSDYLYVSTRRLVNFVETSLKNGLRWAVFEPNTLALRQQITRSARDFLDGIWRSGALFGATANEAYYVRFPDSFNSDADRAAGKLTVEIGLRVTFPAEFVIVRIGIILQNATTA
jgi:phage tail sheath protein FI